MRRRRGQAASSIAGVVAAIALVATGCGDGGSALDAGGVRDAAAADAPIPPGCGDGVRQTGESCDGNDLGGQMCSDLPDGFTGGTLACTGACNLDTSGCTTCGDGVCEPGETAADCPDECGAVQLSVGSHHACAVIADGTLRCWGGADGLWLGGAGDLLRPIRVPDLTGVQKVACGASHTCVLLTGGAVRCWGRNGFGQAGPAPSFVVYPPAEPITGATDIDTGSYHTCVSTSSNEVRCWGRSDYFQTGVRNKLRADATELPAVTTASKVALGGNHSCAVGTSIQCWGGNSYHQLGFTTSLLPGYGPQDWSPDPQNLSLESWGARVFAGDNHTCAIVHASSGSIPSKLVCWGRNANAQVGTGTKDDVPAPLTILGYDVGVKQAALGRTHSCASVGPRVGLTVDPEVLCWGTNDRGQLGTGDTDERLSPTSTAIQEAVIDVSAGYAFTCAILADYTVRCWGANEVGQLGDGTRDDSAVPVTPEGL